MGHSGFSPSPSGKGQRSIFSSLPRTLLECRSQHLLPTTSDAIMLLPSRVLGCVLAQEGKSGETFQRMTVLMRKKSKLMRPIFSSTKFQAETGSMLSQSYSATPQRATFMILAVTRRTAGEMANTQWSLGQDPQALFCRGGGAGHRPSASGLKTHRPSPTSKMHLHTNLEIIK